MKLKMYLALLVMGMLSLQSCSDDDDDLPSSKVPEAVRTAFDSSFSNTANLSWETKTVSQEQYYKAEFNNKSDNRYKTEAWYKADGSWHMTETEMPYSAIPQAVRTHRSPLEKLSPYIHSLCRYRYTDIPFSHFRR